VEADNINNISWNRFEDYILEFFQAKQQMNDKTVFLQN
jgi:hypothetical protein